MVKALIGINDTQGEAFIGKTNNINPAGDFN